MKSKYLLNIFIFCIIVSIAMQNRQSELSWDKTVLLKANTAKDMIYLSSEEKQVFFYTNLVRLNPKLFAKTYLKNYLDSVKMKDDKYVSSLMKDLEKAKPSDVLIPTNDLFEEAKKHAIDMGKTGKIGHNTSKGEIFLKRISELKKTYSIVFENCQYGYNTAIDIVIDLLIDEGISDYGHRKALLNPNLKYAGTSIQKHKGYRWNCVIMMGGEKN